MAAGAAKAATDGRHRATERRRRGQYSVREFTGPLEALTLACLLAAAPLARAQGVHAGRFGASAWYERGLVAARPENCRAAVADFGRAIELQPDYFQALYQRGNCLQALGDHAGAVADYSRAVALPGRVDARFRAYYARADAHRRLGELEPAYADYTQVIALRTDTAALRSRAWVSFYRGRWHEAYQDAAKYVHDTQAKEPDAAYAVILGTLALKAAGSRPAGREVPAIMAAAARRGALAGSGDRLPGDWRRDARCSRPRSRPGERTEARAYLGADLLAQGRQAQAVDILRQVLRDGEPAYLEYDLAYHELRRLGLAQPGDRRRRR